jgi:hypothetical protein
VFRYGRVPPVPAVDPYPSEPPMSAIEAKTYRWERRVSGAEWAAFAGTIPVRVVTYASFARRDE